MFTRVWTPIVRPEWKVTVSDPADPRQVCSLADAGDAALVAACRTGDRDAFDEVVRRHQRQIYAVCYRFAGNHEDASDLAQDAFIRAYRGLSSFRSQSTLATWLYRIAVNVCLNKAASKTPRPEAIRDRDLVASRDESPADSLLRGERAAQVRAAIARLPKKQRAALVLRAYHDLPHEQIAAILGSSVGAVKANFFHALNNLRKSLRTT